MMDHNSIFLSGWCEKAGVRDTQFGPSGWALLKLQQIKVGDLVVPAHGVFLSFSLGADDPAKTARNKEAFAKIQDGGFLTVWDVSTSSYIKRGETKINRTLKASIARHMITKDAGISMNLAAFVGKMIQQPNEEWCEMQCTHRPGPNAKPGDPWPYDSVKVHLPGGRIKVKVGHQYFVAGKVAGKTPAGKEDLIVIANIANGI